MSSRKGEGGVIYQNGLGSAVVWYYKLLETADACDLFLHFRHGLYARAGEIIFAGEEGWRGEILALSIKRFCLVHTGPDKHMIKPKVIYWLRCRPFPSHALLFVSAGYSGISSPSIGGFILRQTETLSRISSCGSGPKIVGLRLFFF